MPVNVIRHTNEPAPPPPTTYDLLGLTRDQAALIRDMMGVIPIGSEVGNKEIFDALYNAIPGVGSDFMFRTNTIGVVSVLHVSPLG